MPNQFIVEFIEYLKKLVNECEKENVYDYGLSKFLSSSGYARLNTDGLKYIQQLKNINYTCSQEEIILLEEFESFSKKRK